MAWSQLETIMLPLNPQLVQRFFDMNIIKMDFDSLWTYKPGMLATSTVTGRHTDAHTQLLP